MKKYIYTVLLILIGLTIPNSVQAAEFHFKSYTLKQEETVKDDVYAFGDSVRIDGIVDGDLIVLADTVQIKGTVTGDLYIFGSTATVDGNIHGNTMIFTNNAAISGVLANNAYILSTYLTYNAQTGADMFTLSFENNLQGSVGDDLRTYAVKSTIDTTVAGDLILLGEQYTVSEEKVSSQIYYNSTLNNIAQEQGIPINNGLKIQSPIPDAALRNHWSLQALTALISFVSMSIVGYILISLTPVKSVEIRKKITDSPDEFLKSLIVGFAIFLIVPIPIFLLIISVVGFPAAMFIVGLLGFVMFFGKTWVELAIGKEILELFGKNLYRPFRSFLVGRIISVIINFIPIVRGFYNTILSMVALGAIFRMKKDYYDIARKEAEEYQKKKNSKKEK